MQWQAHRVRGSCLTTRKIYGQEKGTRRINLSDLKLEVLSQDFVQRVEEPQLMSVGRNQSTT